jgi:membrane protein implicated in regulation of membrane protease activity
MSGKDRRVSTGLRTKAVKYFKRIAILLAAGFIAFAPPGTLIVGALLILGLIGKRWFAAACVLSLCAVAAILFVRRNSTKRGLARRGINRRL